MRKIYKIISLILINAFFLLDICWAGNMDFAIAENADNLSAPLRINEADFFNTFQAQMSFVPEDVSLTFAEINALLGKEKLDPQSHYLAGTGAGLFTITADAQNFVAQNSTGLAFVAIGGITVIASGFLINRLLKNRRFFRRFIHPVHERWYIWRLGLDREQLIDMFIINRIYSTDNRKELLNSVNSWMRNIQNKEKNLADLGQIESDEILAKRLSAISTKLSGMGTDAGYFKPLYWVYSNLYRAPYYKHVLKLNPKINQNDNKFLQYVRSGKSTEWLINEYLAIEITSAGIESRRSAINMLDKLVRAGILNQQTLVNMYLEVADSEFLDIAADGIIGLEAYMNELDQATKIKLILKFQTIINNKEKEVKKAKPLFRRIDDYSRKYEAEKEELLKFQAVLISMVLDLLSNLEKSSDMNVIVNIVASLKRYVDLFGNDVNIQCSGYLEQILAVLIERKDKLAGKLKSESLPTMIANNISGKNNKALKNDKVRLKLKQTVQHIKIVTGLLKQLEQKRNNYGMFSKVLLSIADFVEASRNYKKAKKGLSEQADIGLSEQAKKGLIEQPKIGLIEQPKIGLIEQAI